MRRHRELLSCQTLGGGEGWKLLVICLTGCGVQYWG
jgi:hypothetical protein